MVDKKELEFLTNVSGSPVLGDWTITHISGAIWSGKGKPVGDIQGSTGNATTTLKLMFDGKLNNL